MQHRSVPTDAIVPHVTYRDVAAPIDWQTMAFGFAEDYRYGPSDSPVGAQMRAGRGWIMLKAAREGQLTPAQLGVRRST